MMYHWRHWFEGFQLLELLPSSSYITTLLMRTPRLLNEHPHLFGAPDVLEKAKTQIHVLNELYSELVGIIIGTIRNGEMKYRLVSPSLLLHNEAEKKRGCMLKLCH